MVAISPLIIKKLLNQEIKQANFDSGGTRYFCTTDESEYKELRIRHKGSAKFLDGQFKFGCIETKKIESNDPVGHSEE